MTTFLCHKDISVSLCWPYGRVVPVFPHIPPSVGRFLLFLPRSLLCSIFCLFYSISLLLSTSPSLSIILSLPTSTYLSFSFSLPSSLFFISFFLPFFLPLPLLLPLLSFPPSYLWPYLQQPTLTVTSKQTTCYQRVSWTNSSCPHIPLSHLKITI